ncbi:unnamed protein product, partial [marine sediment metagenome]
MNPSASQNQVSPLAVIALAAPVVAVGVGYLIWRWFVEKPVEKSGPRQLGPIEEAVLDTEPPKPKAAAPGEHGYIAATKPTWQPPVGMIWIPIHILHEGKAWMLVAATKQGRIL